MKTFTIHTDDEEQLNALKAFMKALKIKFEMNKEVKSYNSEFVKKIKESKRQHDNGEYTTVKQEDLKSFLGL